MALYKTWREIENEIAEVINNSEASSWGGKESLKEVLTQWEVQCLARDIAAYIRGPHFD